MVHHVTNRAPGAATWQERLEPMSRLQVTEKTVYSFDELSDDAKETARTWWRDSEAQDWNDSEFVIDDAKRVAAILGIEFSTSTVNLMGGGTRQKPCVYWSGFWSQGDGACFEGSYSYAKGSRKAIREYAPQDKTLHAIADSLAEVQKRNFYQLAAYMKHRGFYYHSGCMVVDVEDSRDSYRDIGDAEETVKQAMRDFADWIYDQLESAYEYSMSDDNVDEAIRANEYEFDDSGNIA